MSKRNERLRREIQFVRSPDGEIVALSAVNHFRGFAAVEKAHEMVEHPEGVTRIVMPSGNLLTIDETYLRSVRALPHSEQRGSHVLFIARGLRTARQVIFQPLPYRKTATMSSGS